MPSEELRYPYIVSKVRKETVSKARLSSKGQLTVPAQVRRLLGLRTGDGVVFERAAAGVLLRKAGTAGDLLGVVPAKRVGWKVARRKAWRERGERLARSSATRTSSLGS